VQPTPWCRFCNALYKKPHQQGACEIHCTALRAPATKNAVFWELFKRFGETSHFGLHSSLPKKDNGLLPNRQSSWLTERDGLSSVQLHFTVTLWQHPACVSVDVREIKSLRQCSSHVPLQAVDLLYRTPFLRPIVDSLYIFVPVSNTVRSKLQTTN